MSERLKKEIEKKAEVLNENFEKEFEIFSDFLIEKNIKNFEDNYDNFDFEKVEKIFDDFENYLDDKNIDNKFEIYHQVKYSFVDEIANYYIYNQFKNIEFFKNRNQKK